MGFLAGIPYPDSADPNLCSWTSWSEPCASTVCVCYLLTGAIPWLIYTLLLTSEHLHLLPPFAFVGTAQTFWYQSAHLAFCFVFCSRLIMVKSIYLSFKFRVHSSKVMSKGMFLSGFFLLVVLWMMVVYDVAITSWEYWESHLTRSQKQWIL